MTYNITMPIACERLTQARVGAFLQWLKEEGYCNGDIDVAIELHAPDDEADEASWNAHQLESKGYEAAQAAMAQYDVTRLNFLIGLAKYDVGYQAGYQSASQKMTDAVQALADLHAEQYGLAPGLDIYGGFSVGLLWMYAEDGLGPKSGIAIEGDGNLILDFEETGFLARLLTQPLLAKLLDKAAELFEVEKQLVVRY